MDEPLDESTEEEAYEEVEEEKELAALLSTSETSPPSMEASSTSDESGSLQYMITNQMRQILMEDLEYLIEEVDAMEPQIAQVVIERKTRRPQSGMPDTWRRGFVEPKKANPVIKGLKNFFRDTKFSLPLLAATTLGGAAFITNRKLFATVGSMAMSVPEKILPFIPIPFRKKGSSESSEPAAVESTSSVSPSKPTSKGSGVFKMRMKKEDPNDPTVRYKKAVAAADARKTGTSTNTVTRPAASTANPQKAPKKTLVVAPAAVKAEAPVAPPTLKGNLRKIPFFSFCIGVMEGCENMFSGMMGGKKKRRRRKGAQRKPMAAKE